MQKYSTDHIAKMSWDAVISQWKAFILLPLLPLLIPLGLIGAAVALKWQDVLPWIGLFYLAFILFYLAYSTAAAQWAETLFNGKKNLDIKAGLQYGLKRIPGVLGTGLLTGIKVLLWMLLFFYPGLYKMLVYSQATQISQLNAISGGDAHRLSKMLVKEAGILRTLGNFSVLGILIYLMFLVFYIIGAICLTPVIVSTTEATTPPTFSQFSIPLIGAALVGIACFGLMMGFMTCFKNFQFLAFRDENKTVFQKTIKDLKRING